MAMEMHSDANLALHRLIIVRAQIDKIDDQVWDLETRLSLAEICDIIIDLMQHGPNRTDPFDRFTRILNGLITILRRWHYNTINLRNFVSDHVDKAEEARNRGNETQILWTGVNCLANAAGVAAIFIPGLNVPLMVAGIGGSVIGIWKRIESDKKNKEEFADIMKAIEGHDDYKMISFADVIIQMQAKFEETRDQLIENYKFDKHAANIVATLQMIIESMLNNLIVAPEQQQGIQKEIAVDILSQIKNFISVAFQNYGRHLFNMMDDTFDYMVGTVKGLSIALVAMTFAINFKQLLSETKERAEKVRKVTKMKDKVQCGADSIQFFITTMHEIREQINALSRKAMEEELKKMKEMADRTNEQVAKHNQLFMEFERYIGNGNNITNSDDVVNLQPTDFTEN
ncbi:hypothetical protein HA402_015819 [Bradysia odoriphaga]|nr:hypothetical protein HA402_015819 [Bradysia odoriphaga]